MVILINNGALPFLSSLLFLAKKQMENVEFFMTNYFKVILNVIHNNKIRTRRHSEYSGSGRGEGVST